MSLTSPRSRHRSCLALAHSVVNALRATTASDDLAALMGSVARELGFRYYALIHHDDLRMSPPHRVDLKDYPAAIGERLFGQEQSYRRDPIIRGCLFSDSAFIWSDLSKIIELDSRDRASFDFGVREGLNEGITVPYVRIGDCMGSCTFAGTRFPQKATRYLGVVQMIGIFAFQAARRLVAPSAPIAPQVRLHPRPRDCVALAGRGLSNKEIARALALTPRTVDGYLTEARRHFQAHDRTELVVSAVLAGEVGLHELRRQPE